ncbi:iron-containing alcohol dehydrogenase [Rhodospirillales bacterium YIM 152171]|uniref:Iron-containing alcohol dehydrogenase n=1 Tax=Marinimicrococcus flavescens TaxID=3031815 RepID=A0AAP3UZT2_9PROT|nr:iron-containing alcohol dehydrogenase [Marinimicrococcus flavescens]
MTAPDLRTFATSWAFPTTVLFGVGGIAKAPRACQGAGMSRPLVVTDRGLADLPFVGTLMEALAGAGLEPLLFAEVRSNPVGANVEAGVAAFGEGRCDGVLAIGGGSALDAGKAIAFQAGQTRPFFSFAGSGGRWRQADADAIRPVVAIPTTAGTGSEVSQGVVITEEAGRSKQIVFHPSMMPKAAILDADLTIGLPPLLTAGTGMDALAHCLEAYCAPGFHPMCEGIAVEGVRLVREALPRAHADGADREARSMMLAASAMGAVAFQKGLGAVHSLSHPIGAVHDTHHGLTNGVLLPYVLAHNRPAIEERIVRLAGWLGLPKASFSGFLDWLLELRATLAVPHSLAALGVPGQDFAGLARMAAADPTAAGNPLPVDEQSLRILLEQAHDGTAF